MTPQEQQALFVKASKRFGWPDRQTSGYVHGVVDGLVQKRPHQDYVDEYRTDRYATGYIDGFLDASGTDTIEWMRGLNLPYSTAYRWWQDVE